jgi:hypothetical protein
MAHFANIGARPNSDSSQRGKNCSAGPRLLTMLPTAAPFVLGDLPGQLGGNLSCSAMGDDTFVPVMFGCRYDESREPRLPGGVTRRRSQRTSEASFIFPS